MTKNGLAILCASVSALWAQDTITLENPYGICAHVTHGELEVAPGTYEKLKAIHVTNVRTDFDWKVVEPSQGVWNFTFFDGIVNQADKEGIELLPILDYDVSWAKPVWGNLDKWAEYVQKTVSRYAKTLRYWEVWNEPNLPGFWEGAPSALKYTDMLKRAYNEIKQIDPTLTVVYGGTSGVPLGYFEESFQAGGGDFCDVINIHPYHWQGTPELLVEDLRGLRAVMNKYNIGNKPIWITEVGWSTAKILPFYRHIIRTALNRAGITPAEVEAAVIFDPENGFPGAVNYQPVMDPPLFKGIHQITFSELAGLDVARYPVLIPTANETFPSAYIPALVDYVKRGGTIILPSGIPLYYDLKFNGEGGFEMNQVSDTHMKTFHIAWEAWWTRDGVPESEKWQKLAPEFQNAFTVPLTPSGRFLTDKNLEPGDQFIPILEAGTDNYKAAVAALYKLNSDLKGNVIVTTSLEANQTVPEDRQAEMLPRTYLIGLSCGAQRVYWYNLRSKEWDQTHREAHFGIVHHDLSAKPSYIAYGTLTRLCPDGSKLSPLSHKGPVYWVSWTRPDGVKVWAVWSSGNPQPLTLKIQGTVTELLNHLGQKQEISADGKYTATPSILYFVGPESVAIE